MSKLEETNVLISACAKIEEAGIHIDYNAVLLDIAKSLAMIADKLCEDNDKDGREV